MNIEELVSQRFAEKNKITAARYFLVKVEGVAIGRNNPDAFQVSGTRIDTGDQVRVISKKSASGQAMPEVGGIFRADKATQQKSENGITHYTADYFHAYGNNDFCLTATVQAQPPKKDESTGMWSAQVRAIDHTVNTLHVPADKFNDRDLAAAILPALKPWQATESSSITHDAKGDHIWANPVKGVNPFALVRFAGKTLTVYGIGAVERSPGVVEFPTDDEIIQKIKSNVPVQNMIAVLKDLPKDALAKVAFTVIPGMTINVGRESLAGESQKYLAVPQAFSWVDQSRVDPSGKPASYAGWRENAQVHMKLTRTDRMVVVDVVPGSNGTLHKSIPETEFERKVRLEKAAGADQEQGANVSQPAAAQQQAPVQQAPVQQESNQQPNQRSTAQARRAAPQAQSAPVTQAANAYDDEFEDMGGGAMDDYEDYANDLSAMESMNAAPANLADDDFDAIMAEAETKMLARRSGPSM